MSKYTHVGYINDDCKDVVIGVDNLKMINKLSDDRLQFIISIEEAQDLYIALKDFIMEHNNGVNKIH